MRRSRLYLLPPVIALAAGPPATGLAAPRVELAQYQPTPFADRLLRLDGAGVLPFGQYRVGVDTDYARTPLRLSNTAPVILPGASLPDYVLVAHAAGATLQASFGLGHGLEAALAVPLTLLQTGESAPEVADPSPAGVGNIRLGLKARLGAWRGLGAGAALLLLVPGGVGTLTHDPAVGAEARIFGELRRGRLLLGLRLGLRLRQPIALYDVRIGNEIGFAAGAEWALPRGTSLFVEAAGVTAADAPFGRSAESPVEALAGLRQRFGAAWLALAAGPGLSDGYGSPAFRALLALTWGSQPPPDGRGDGVAPPVPRNPFKSSPPASEERSGVVCLTACRSGI